MNHKSPKNIAEELNALGRVWFRGAIDEATLHQLEQFLPKGGKPGERISQNCKYHEFTRDTLFVQGLDSILSSPKPVRIVGFNKTITDNWAISWHQDRVIAVKERADNIGFSNWSCKSKVWHCEPPTVFLENMLFVRIHLDQVDETNGAMKIALRSHKFGKVSSNRILELIEDCEKETCAAQRGDVLIMKMLLIHCSESSTSKRQRRALRIDYSNFELPTPLKWVD